MEDCSSRPYSYELYLNQVFSLLFIATVYHSPSVMSMISLLMYYALSKLIILLFKGSFLSMSTQVAQRCPHPLSWNMDMLLFFSRVYLYLDWRLLFSELLDNYWKTCPNPLAAYNGSLFPKVLLFLSKLFPG